jgi:hypothetical protein
VNDDREFFALLLEMWKHTTHVEDHFWRPESTEHGWVIVAEGPEGNRVQIASGLSERDADWITGLHGCFNDVIGRIVRALDEADAADERYDRQQQLLAELSGNLPSPN